MRALQGLIIQILSTLLTLVIYVHASQTYNVALSSNSGGYASAYSSPYPNSSYGTLFAHNGQLTFCNDASNCPGSSAHNMFKSLAATNTTDVWLQFKFNSTKTIRSVYLSLDESNTSQHIGMELWIGYSLTNRTLCYKVPAATYSTWLSCGTTGIAGTSIWITMPVIGQSLNIAEVMAYELYYVQGSSISQTATYSCSSADTQTQFPNAGYYSGLTSALTDQNAFQRGTETTCTTLQQAPSTSCKGYYMQYFPANFKIFAVVVLTQISQLHAASSSDYTSNLNLVLRAGSPNTETTTSPFLTCTPSPKSDPLSNPEFNCQGALAYGTLFYRTSNDVKLGICSTGILTNCNCTQTSFAKTNISSSRYFSSKLINQTSIQLKQNEIAYFKLFTSDLTDSVSLICGDRTGTKWCGNRTPVILFTNGTVYDMTWPNSLFSYNSSTDMISIYPTKTAHVGTFIFTLKAYLSDYSSLGQFPQSTNFTLTVSAANFDSMAQFLVVLDSNNESFDYLQYQVVNDGVKKSEFLLIMPEVFQSVKWSPVFNLTSTSTYISQIYTNQNDFDGCRSSSQTVCIMLDTDQYSISMFVRSTIPDFNLTMQIYVSAVNSDQISQVSSIQHIYVNVVACQVDTIAPVTSLLSYSYTLNSGQVAFKPSDYIQSPQCYNTYILTNVTLSSQVPEYIQQIVTPSLRANQLWINENNTVLLRQTIILQITALFPDGSINDQAKINITFLESTSKPIKDSFNETLSKASLYTQTNSSESEIPRPYIKFISRKGLVTLQWNVDMDIPNNLTTLTVTDPDNFTVPLNVTILPGSKYQDPINLNITNYTVINYTKRQMLIQLQLQNASLISMKKYKDILQIVFNNQTFFKSNQGITVPKNVTIKKQMPKQYFDGAFIIKISTQAVTAILAIMTVSQIIGTTIFKFLLSSILQNIKLLKIISHMILIPLNYPGNLMDFFAEIFPLYTFDLLPTDDLYEWMFRTSDFDDEDISEIFDDVGYNETLVINNMGSIFLYIILQIIIILFHQGVAALLKDN